MIDMDQTIIPKSDQLNADDLLGGKTLTIKVTDVKEGDKDQPIVIRFEGDNGKPYKPGKSMRRVLRLLWGRDGKAYIGKSLRLYCDETVMFGGVKVGGIRISHMEGLKEQMTVALTASKSIRKPFTVKPLTASEQPKQEPATSADPEVIKAGEAAAALGVDAYVKWRDGLAANVKETVRSHNGEWSKKAKAADAAKLEVEQPKTEPAGDDEIP